MPKLTHADSRGSARMVDVGGKRRTRREATARGTVRFGRIAYRLLKENRLAKGDALAVARLAGIQAGKRASEWIPLCHPIPIEHLELAIDLDDARRAAQVTAVARARWSTGVEMEALVAVAAACLALYDMTKAVERGVRVTEIELLAKSGGRSGAWKRPVRD